MDGDRNDRQVEIVKHDIDVLVYAFLKAKVQMKSTATNILQRVWIIRPGGIKRK